MKLFKINLADNVAVALEAITAGETDLVLVSSDIDPGHKVAISDIKKGEAVIKYGFRIGTAKEDIKKGDWVHTHNVKTALDGVMDYTYTPQITEIPKNDPLTFDGYVRENGSVGIRNEIWIIPTVGCVNKTAELLANQANKALKDGVDGVYYFSHPYGCSQLGDDHETTQKLLSGLVNHPNAAGVLVLGLGCENNNIPEFKKILGDINPNRIKFCSAQDFEDETVEGLKLINELMDYASSFKREKCPSSKLVVGLKCGGSDAFSGITANPLVGNFSDLLISQGGSTILTEVPEMFGAEQILMDRCITRAEFDKTVNLINGFKEYFIRHNQVVYENPSPGNKKGGITTLEDKSLGCTQKGGTSPVVDVLNYGEHVTTQGLNLMWGPGNDIVASTVLTAAGAHIILFTTGRGTPLGAPAPTIKISSNSALASKKANWIDFNAGRLLEDVSMEDLSAELLSFVLDIASGKKKTNSEINGYREIAIFKDGVTL